MAFEIERKFLVDHEWWPSVKYNKAKRIVQGYLFIAGDKCCRIRITDNEKAILNIKKEIDDLHRHEFEIVISMDEARMLLEQMGESFIEKIRYEVGNGELKWEVDVFEGANKGLIIAEIELPSADTFFEKPPWLGKEVTSDKRYLNTNLATHPYCSW
ncbi:MAG TPA: CYTH domain-containing protein [Phnomibacter sp.]|nr:CYTH domain-containing protein [Phnomibacter sp.]